ncbi:hypothetical protein D3C86_1414690 [compost metagenome]
MSKVFGRQLPNNQANSLLLVALPNVTIAFSIALLENRRLSAGIRTVGNEV